ncbi:MAG: response regulator [Bdellovibrionaceae bacterium]|nr:response regulator [Pseudobdellovibrionaceae bacterium]
MIHWMKDISIAKKLSTLVGVLILLITVELFALHFSFTTLSALRSFVGLAGHWSIAQKNATLSLYTYSVVREEKHYQDFLEASRVPAGFKRARTTMETCEDIRTCTEKIKIVTAAFTEAGLPPSDIPNIIRLIRFVRGLPHMESSADLWRKSDRMYEEVLAEGETLHREIESSSPREAVIAASIERIGELNQEFSGLQAGFTKRMTDGARALEKIMMILLIAAVGLVGGTGIVLIYGLSRYFRRSIGEVRDVAMKVGGGDFTQRVPVRSQDELGCMAHSLNKMIEDLQTSIGRQEKAESANQVKSLFLANMSHEVRTPMGVILGLVEVLKDPNLTEEDRQKYIAVIEQTGKNLQQIINDILDISKVEAGHLDIHSSTFELNEFIDELNANLQLLAHRGKNVLEFRRQGEISELLSSDRTRLRQILTNLVGNALKFTHEGSVTVFYGQKDKTIFFRVCDTGIGINESEHGQLFKAFSQLDHSASRKYGGTGLGLLLSRRLAQYMGGDIQLESSRPGVGSVFILTLPYQPELGSGQKPVELVPPVNEDYLELSGKHVLVVEDSIDNQLLVKVFLGRKNMVLDFANNGREGIEKALAHRYDLVLMDMQMPVVDGYAATEELRRRGYSVPIIALTAHAMKEDRERCLRVGCNEYLTKPIDARLFYRTLAAFISSTS